jgi:hypothetical protein
MPAPSEPFAAVYEHRNRLGVIVARAGGLRGLRGGRSLPRMTSALSSMGNWRSLK